MIEIDRVQELIEFHKTNLRTMHQMYRSMGGNANPMATMTHDIAVELTNDTISALREYADMCSLKNMIDSEE